MPCHAVLCHAARVESELEAECLRDSQWVADASGGAGAAAADGSAIFENAFKSMEVLQSGTLGE